MLEQIRNRTLTKDMPYQIIQSQTVIKGDIVYLTDDTIINALQGYTMCEECGQIYKKREFLQSQQIPFYGVLHKYQDRS